VNRIFIIFALLVALNNAHAEDRDWPFVSSVGGMAIGEPTKSGAGWELPINADVSGLRQVTDKPTLLNSALVCDIKATIAGDTITLVLQTGLVHKGKSSACPAAKLGSLSPGTYQVNYLSNAAPIHLRDIRIPK
jgi:hypothetical protein